MAHQRWQKYGVPCMTLAEFESSGPAWALSKGVTLVLRRPDDEGASAESLEALERQGMYSFRIKQRLLTKTFGFVYKSFETQQLVGLAQEALEGPTLAEFIQQHIAQGEHVPEDLAYTVSLQLTRALIALSEQGLVHKGALSVNVVLTGLKRDQNGSWTAQDVNAVLPKVTSFDLSLHPASGQTAEGTSATDVSGRDSVVGTTDLAYALGVALWELWSTQLADKQTCTRTQTDTANNQTSGSHTHTSTDSSIDSQPQTSTDGDNSIRSDTSADSSIDKGSDPEHAKAASQDASKEVESSSNGPSLAVEGFLPALGQLIHSCTQPDWQARPRLQTVLKELRDGPCAVYKPVDAQPAQLAAAGKEGAAAGGQTAGKKAAAGLASAAAGDKAAVAAAAAVPAGDRAARDQRTKVAGQPAAAASQLPGRNRQPHQRMLHMQPPPPPPQQQPMHHPQQVHVRSSVHGVGPVRLAAAAGAQLAQPAHATVYQVQQHRHAVGQPIVAQQHGAQYRNAAPNSHAALWGNQTAPRPMAQQPVMQPRYNMQAQVTQQHTVQHSHYAQAQLRQQPMQQGYNVQEQPRQQALQHSRQVNAHPTQQHAGMQAPQQAAQPAVGRQPVMHQRLIAQQQLAPQPAMAPQRAQAPQGVGRHTADHMSTNAAGHMGVNTADHMVANTVSHESTKPAGYAADLPSLIQLGCLEVCDSDSASMARICKTDWSIGVPDRPW